MGKDNWKGRAVGMVCATCVFFVEKAAHPKARGVGSGWLSGLSGLMENASFAARQTGELADVADSAFVNLLIEIATRSADSVSFDPYFLADPLMPDAEGLCVDNPLAAVALLRLRVITRDVFYSCMSFFVNQMVRMRAESELAKFVYEQPEGKGFGRCRRHAPTMSGYPVVFSTDWCGDHKLDENKIKL